MGPKPKLATLAFKRARFHCSREDQRLCIPNVRRCAFSIPVTGANYQQMADGFLWNDLILPCAMSFYEAQKSMVTILLRNARLSVVCQLSVLKPETILVFDGAIGEML
jgi:hypothetical protein